MILVGILGFCRSTKENKVAFVIILTSMVELHYDESLEATSMTWRDNETDMNMKKNII